MSDWPEYIDNVPNISGNEQEIERLIAAHSGKPVFLPDSKIDFGKIKSAFTIALHMHQPMIPAGGGDLHTAELISNLQHMMENQGIGDNHNAPVFDWCYKRMGEFIPQLVSEGHEPRVMLEYSGSLLHGLRKMGNDDTIEHLKTITCTPEYARCVEWLGAPWGHAVAPSTPVQDFRLHVRAWQHHFAAIFGTDAMVRVRGFSPSEMALPNHPDVAYEYVKTLVECGFQWLLVQEHTVEQPEDGHHPHHPHLPHRLVVKNSKGEEASIIALVKTQGSDTKLVAQMQPYYEAKSLSRTTLAGKSVPPLVSQIADGENGGVMMNEFPPKFLEASRETTGADTVGMNGTEYLEHLFAMGITEADLPVVQPLFHKMIWDRMSPGDGPEKLAQTIETIRGEDHRFHMEGGSWTSDLSWVRGYEDVLKPMDEASSHFYEKVIKAGVATNDPRYRNALFHLLNSQTSCYRYWGEGIWTDYGKEICRRVDAIIDNDF
ncbi:glycosyl hydrolase family 57 [Magnetofaba australis]|uniref:Putative glycosyl hydrolase, family 57 n=1 Tax=Magnetofaba australis IT-1 TaxID=1434232 RepID=A0A1Y2K9W4_9PROT|nr:glycosyl hydrolase family 57 [Magnetofaba australis]OSM07280.1 putative glycosyl hydrolase, family 57 [Magnetofaba australis IT-1]